MALYEETKQIQQELDNKYYQQDDPLKFLFTKLHRDNASLISAGEAPIQIDPTEDSGIYLPKDSRRFSRFFGEVYNPLANIEDAAARRQPWIEKVAQMQPRIAIKVISEIAQLPGYWGGALAWATTGFDTEKVGLMIDNFWLRAIQDAEQTVKDQIPVYVSDRVREGNLLQNILSPEFWATEGADGIGFLLAFLAPGRIFKAVGLGAKAARLVKPGNKISQLMAKGATYEQAVQAATKGMKETFDFVGATLVNTLFESAAEGGETYRNVFDKTGDTYKAANAAVDVVGKNFVLLMLTNAFDQYWLFKDIKMFKKAGQDASEKLAKKNIFDRLMDPDTNEILSEVRKKTKLENAGELAKKLFVGIGKEGFIEEGMQYAFSEAAERDVENPEQADRDFVDGMINIAKVYIDSLTDVDMQKSIFLGSVLGGGMSMVGYAREQAAEKRLIEGTSAKTRSPFAKFLGMRDRAESPGLKKLLERNMGSYHIELADVVKLDKDNNPELNPDGTYVWDTSKMSGLIIDRLVDYATKEALVTAYNKGDTETFKLIKDRMDYKYMSLFIEQEGGIYALLRHIDEMSELEREYFAKEGVDFDLETIKKELKDKALRFQDMYDRVNNTHDLLMTDVKYKKEDRNIFNAFSKEIKEHKLQEERLTSFHDRRINEVRNTLANLKYNEADISVASDENNLSDKLVDSLKQAYNERKDIMSDGVRHEVEKNIDIIEYSQKKLKESREYSADLYDKKWLQSTFEEKVEEAKEHKKSNLNEDKAVETANLPPKLSALYEKAVITEEFEEPIKAVARHSGEIMISYTTEDGKTHRIAGQIVGSNKENNLTLKSTQEEVNGRLRKVEAASTFYLNEDDTVGVGGVRYKINPDGIDIIKSPEEMMRERRSLTFLSALKEQLQAQREGIKSLKYQSTIQHENIKELKSKAEELDRKELEILERTGSRLTAKGTERKISVTTLERQWSEENRQYTYVKKRQFLNARELQDELKKAEANHKILLDKVDAWTENRRRVSDIIKKAKEDGEYYKIYEGDVKETEDSYRALQDLINTDRELLDNSTLYLKRLRSTLKGYFTSFAKILGIERQLNQIRLSYGPTYGLTEDQIEEQSLELISSALASTELTDDMIKELGLLPKYLETVLQRIQETKDNINAVQSNLAEQEVKLNELYRKLQLYNPLSNKIRSDYLKYLKDTLGSYDVLTEKDVVEAETPENTMKDLWNKYDTFLRSWEKEFRHVYVDEDSFIVSGGNQRDLMEGEKNDDLARWYIFVSKLAHQGNNSRFILKTFTTRQIGKLKEDDPIRKNLKFYAGKIRGVKQYVTYDQLQDLPQANKNIADNDIKIVVHNSDGELFMSSKQVVDGSDKKYYIIYNSLLEQDTNLFGDRFSKEKAIEARIREKKYPIDTEEERKAARDLAEAYVNEKFDKDFEKYQKFREDLKKNSYYLAITAINPGVTNELASSEIEVSEFLGDENMSMIDGSLYVHKIGTRRDDVRDKDTRGNYGHRLTRQFSGAEHGVLSGYTYLGWDNRFHLIKPRTLGETGSVEDVLNIIRYLATNPKKYEEIENYLHSIVYLNAKNKKYRLYFTKFYGPSGTRRGFRTLLYGDKEISYKDLVEGNNLDELREFLANKYWNFDEDSMKASSFTEYKVTWTTTGKPNIDYTLWDTKDGAYTGFLFSPKDGRIPKGTIRGVPAKSSPLESIKNPNSINQSLSMKSLGVTYKKKSPPKTNNTETKPTSKSSEGLGRKSTSSESTGRKTSGGDSSIEQANESWANMSDKEKIERMMALRSGAVQKGTTSSRKSEQEPEKSFGVRTTEDSSENLAEPISRSSAQSFESANEHWNSLSDAEKIAYLKTLKTDSQAVAKNKVYDAYKQSGDELYRVREQNETFIKEELDSKVKWFSDKFPQIPIKVIQDVLMGDAWGKLTRDGAVLVSDLAAEGTVYHEAYHVYSLLFQSEEERNELYNEVRDRLNRPDMTDKQAEEFLAEEFRMFMMSPNEYKFGEKDKVVKSWFEKLLDFILDILKDFGIVKSDRAGFKIEETFNKINTENSFRIADEVLTERINNLRSEYNHSRTVADLSEKETMYAVQDFNFHFFQSLFNPNLSLNKETLFELDMHAGELYTHLYILYNTRKHEIPLYAKIFDNFDEVAELHRKFLRRYGIIIPMRKKVSSGTEEESDLSERTSAVTERDFEELEFEDEYERGNNKMEYMSAVQVNMDKLIDNPIRMLIAGLPAVTNVNGMLRADMSEYLTRSTARYGDIIRVLKDNLAGSTSVEEMAQIMRSLTNEYPELDILLRRLGLKEPGNANVTTQQVNLQNQFYKNFALNKNNPILQNFTHTGSKYSFSATEDHIEDRMRNEWFNNARNIAIDPSKPSYTYRVSKSGNILINIKELKQDLKFIGSLHPTAKLEPSIYLLSKLGIDLPVIPNKVIDNYIYWLNDSLKDIKKDISIYDFYNRDIVKVQKEFDALIEYASRSYLNHRDLSYFNQDGVREYAITLNTHLSNTVNLLKNIRVDRKNKIREIPPELEYLMAWDNDTESGSLFNRNSIWLEYILHGRQLELVLLKGVVTPTDGFEISNLKPGDYKAMYFNSLLQGTVPLLRSASRKLEYGLKIGTVNPNIDDTIFKQTMHRYLRDELSTSFALLLDPENWGGRLKHYSKNAKELRVFNFIHEDKKIASLEQFVKDNVSVEYDSIPPLEKTKADTVNEADKLVDQFLKVYKKRIDNSFNEYLEDLYRMTYESLEEDMVIVKESRGRINYKYQIPGLDTEVIKELGMEISDTDPTLSTEQMDRLVRIATYHSFVGNNEQLKLFLGDAAYFRNPADIHKRINGLTSPKYNQRDDLFIREHLDQNYKRFDNKTRGDSVSMVVVEDILYNNKELAKLYPQYAKSSATDAQSWATLDTYRDIMLRHGMWYPRHERTYQFEMQKFAIRLRNLIKEKGDIYKISLQYIEDQFTSPNGAFYNHTDGKIPEEPLYHGEKIDEYKLTPLQILKPQGFGPISNHELRGLNATSFLKTSTAPIFMSAIHEDSPMFEFLIDMMANQQEILAFSDYGGGSAIKADVLGDDNGKIQRIFERDSYFAQELRYRDFGIQLDIHEESEGEVTVSTQRTRIEFRDIFNAGVPVGANELVQNRHEYTELTNDIESQLRQELLDELGIIREKVYTDRESTKSKKTTKTVSKTVLPKAKDYIGFSGAATGADTYWRKISESYGIGEFIDYTTSSIDELDDGDRREVERAYVRAADILGRPIMSGKSSFGKLVRRDYLQVKDADAVFAIGIILEPSQVGKRGYENTSGKQVVDGGTGYAVQMALDLGKPVYVFDQVKKKWFTWRDNIFTEIDTPVLTQNYAAVGSRELRKSGMRAIDEVFKKTFDSGEIEVTEKVEEFIEEAEESTGAYYYRYLLPEHNKEKFINKLLNSFERRETPLNVLDGVKLSLDKRLGLNVFDLSLSKFKIEEILMSLVRENLIKRKIYGEMLIQESSFLYENPNSKERLLKFYEKIGKGEDAEVGAMQVMISVPRGMRKFVEDIGGVEVLNKVLDHYYATGDSGILGDDFIDIITFPANRIPSQSLSSLDIVQVRRFLPYHHGNKIIIPPEATTKTGSDFDVDKLTAYFNNFYYKDGKLRLIDDIKSIKGKQNRLNIIAVESTLHPSRFNELVEPLDSSYFKDYAKSVAGRRGNITEIESRSNNPQWRDIIQSWFNIQKGYEFWTSNAGIGASAVPNVMHAIEQNHPLLMTGVIPIMFEGQELNPGEYYQSGFIKDGSGRNIARNFAEFITAFVDAVKDPFIFQLTDLQTFSAMATLNRFGRDTSVGIDSIIEFYSQDVVKDFLKIKRVNTSQFMFFNQYNTGRDKFKFSTRLNRDQQYRTVLQKIKSTLNPTIDIPIGYKQSVANAVDEYIQMRTKVYNSNEKLERFSDIADSSLKAIEIAKATDSDPRVIKAKEEISKRINEYGYKYLTLEDLKNVKTGENLSNDDLFRLQVQILDNFMMYDQLGWNMGVVNSFLRPDASSSLARHLSAVDANVQVNDQTIRKRGIFDPISIYEAVSGTGDNPSLIREFFRTKQDTSDYYSWGSLINYSPLIKNFFVDNIYSVFANADRRLSRVKAEDAIDTIENNFLSFLLVKMFGTMTSTDLQRTYRSIFKGRNSIAKQLLRVKDTLKDNLAINELEAVISRKLSVSQSISELDKISLFSKQFDTNQWDAMEADIYNLYHSSEDNKAFVHGLIYLNTLQSGYKKSPTSFSEVIPNRIFVPMAAVALQRFVELPEADQLRLLNNFVSQLYRNNASNKNIVPRHIFPVKYMQTYIKDSGGYYKNFDYVSANMYIGDERSYWDQDRKAPMTVALYERDPEDFTMFRLITKLGGEFFEYYPDATDEEVEEMSILNSNKYEFKLDNPIEVEKSKTTNRRGRKGQTFEEGQADYQDVPNTSLYFDSPPVKQLPARKKTTKKTTTKRKSGRNYKTHGSTDGYYSRNTYLTDGKTSYAKRIPGATDEKGTTLQVVTRSIERNSNDPVLVALARMLKNQITIPVPFKIYNSEVKSNTVTERGDACDGFTRTTEDGRIVDMGAFDQLDDNSFERTAIHEGLHVLTLYKYKNDNIFKNQVDNLFNHVNSYMQDEVNPDDYSAARQTLLSDPIEFISYAISDPVYQEFLSTVPAYNEDNIKDLSKSVFAQFIDFLFDMVRNLFIRTGETNIIDRSAFKELISIVDDALLRKPDDTDELYVPDADTGTKILGDIDLKEDVKANNEFELNKENTANNLNTETSNMESFVKNFDETYPQYKYLSDIEKIAYQEAIDKGEIKLVCGL